MTKIITFDGNMASGKNTNVNKVCEHFGIPPESHSTYNKIIECKSINAFDMSMFPWLSVMSHKNIGWKNRNLVVIKDFWNCLIKGIMKD